MKEFKLHKQYGLNPTKPVCIYCRKTKNEIAFLGSAYKDKAPMQMAVDRNPCDECEANFSKGIALIEVEENSSIPTGRVVVVTPEGAKKFFSDSPMRDKVMKIGRCYVEKGALDSVFNPSSN